MKTVKSVKNSLKFKAEDKEGMLSIKIGLKRYTLPVNARLISGEGYLYLSFPASSELYRVGENDLQIMASDADAADANTALAGSKSRAPREGRPLPDSLAEALKSIPAGHKIVANEDGSHRLVKTRTRKLKTS